MSFKISSCDEISASTEEVRGEGNPFSAHFNDRGFLFECKQTSPFPDGVVWIKKVTALFFSEMLCIA